MGGCLVARGHAHAFPNCHTGPGSTRRTRNIQSGRRTRTGRVLLSVVETERAGGCADARVRKQPGGLAGKRHHPVDAKLGRVGCLRPGLRLRRRQTAANAWRPILRGLHLRFPRPRREPAIPGRRGHPSTRGGLFAGRQSRLRHRAEDARRGPQPGDWDWRFPWRGRGGGCLRRGLFRRFQCFTRQLAERGLQSGRAIPACKGQTGALHVRL